LSSILFSIFKEESLVGQNHLYICKARAYHGVLSHSVLYFISTELTKVCSLKTCLPVLSHSVLTLSVKKNAPVDVLGFGLDKLASTNQLFVGMHTG
jgi:hypothetical protein